MTLREGAVDADTDRSILTRFCSGTANPSASSIGLTEDGMAVILAGGATLADGPEVAAESNASKPNAKSFNPDDADADFGSVILRFLPLLLPDVPPFALDDVGVRTF